MGKNLEKRRNLFKRFSGQLILLKTNGLIDREFEYEDPYVCPICLREFSEDHLDESKYQNYLTAEDAPPDALGGSKIALTCRECNNSCGQEIDCHLIDALRAIDDSFFYPGSKQSATIEFEGKKITVELEALGNGTLTAYHRIKYNNPTLLDKFIYGIKNKTIGPLLNFVPPARKLDQKRINYAVHKTNYIITFSKFGYIFLLSPQYDDLRRQLLNPTETLFELNPFIKNQFSKDNMGTYYVLNDEFKSILNVFSMTTEYSETVIGGFIQPPAVDIETFAEAIDQQRDVNGVVNIQTSFYDPDANLFENIQEILKIKNWIDT